MIDTAYTYTGGESEETIGRRDCPRKGAVPQAAPERNPF
jgi:hypothetical protein